MHLQEEKLKYIKMGKCQLTMSSRTNGDVTVKNGSEYEIEAAGEVKLAGGFTVEKGAAFAIRPASF